MNGTVQQIDLAQKFFGKDIIKGFDRNGNAILNFAVWTDATDTATTTNANVRATVILADIVHYAQEKARFLNAVKQVVAPAQTATVKLPITNANITFDEQTAALGTTDYETAERDWTDISNITSVSFAYTLFKYGAAISKELVKSVSVDYVAEAKNQLAFDVTKRIDQAIAQGLEGATPANTLYGGDAAAIGQVDNGDILTTDLIADAIIELDEEGWENTPDQPYMLYIHPKQKAALLKDSQFTNAAEYGSNKVVLSGEIGEYLGAKVITSTRLTDQGSSMGATAGRTVLLVKSQVCGGIVWFEKPNLSAEYNLERACTQVYMDVAYATDSLQDKAIVHVDVSDA